MTTAELLEQRRELSREEQLQLAHDLGVEADGPNEDTEVEDAWAVEIGQRLQDVVDETTTGLPDGDVRKHFGL